jgi:hypothetical protein
MRLESAMCDFCGNIVEDIVCIMCCMIVLLTMPLWLNVVHLDARDSFIMGDLSHWIAFNE